MNDFKVVGMDKARKILIVRSTKPKKEFKFGGTMSGNHYQFGINKHTFRYCGESLKRMTGMTDEEYKKWKKAYELD